MRKYAKPAGVVVLVAVLALVLWRVYRPAKVRPRPLGDGEIGLLVLELLPGDDGLLTTHRLVRYSLKDGVAGVPEIVWTGGVGLLGYHGKTTILDDHYLVSNSAGVLDLKTGKVIHSVERAGLRGVEGGQVFYRVRGSDGEYDYFVFDPTRGKVTPLDAPGKWALKGLLSPDGTKSVEDHFAGLTLHRVGADSKLLGENFHVSYGVLSSSAGQPPVLWLDNDRVLTQTDNGKLVVVQVNDGSRTPAVTLPATKEIVSPPRLSRDANGDVIYECGSESFWVDPDARQWRRQPWRVHGHGFETSPGRSDCVVRYEGESIGRQECNCYVVAVTEGHFASLGEGGVWVWAASRGQWTFLKGRYDRVVGWVR
jgi:hypothetical protein